MLVVVVAQLLHPPPQQLTVNSGAAVQPEVNPSGAVHNPILLTPIGELSQLKVLNSLIDSLSKFANSFNITNTSVPSSAPIFLLLLMFGLLLTLTLLWW